ncbi:mannitol dehydrogenase family protein [Rhodoglobus aureus]|uniref:Mannitol-1-phosphate 5-dehydrogenase n=2 Tax=Rhodoglobus aureus TaxID=191497 RepID=A0ABP4G6H1_9MICO
MYLDRLLNAGEREWGICGVGVLPFDLPIRDALDHQDNLYTLVTKDTDEVSQAAVIGSIVEYLYAPDDPQAVVDKLADLSTRIVSLTITEGGYSINDATGEFDPRDPLTLADIGSKTTPRSVLGLIVAGLARRRAADEQPFTVMSCDNIQGNGAFAKKAVVEFARRKDTGLATWIEEYVAFPNSMVDRITPVTTDETRASIQAEFGIDDEFPVLSEAFEQWVLEDRFTLGRPALETVGVQVVGDVEPYELMKLRLLNASHQAIAFTGILAGETYVHEVCRRPVFSDFLLGYMRNEAIPTLLPVPGVDLDDYCQQLISRFSSQAILDTLARLAVDASDRIPKFLLPVVQNQLSNDRETRHSSLVLAAWCTYLETHAGQDDPTPIVDKRRDGLAAAVALEQRAPGSFLDYADVFGNLGENDQLRQEFIGWRERIANVGIVEAISTI